MNLIFRMLEEKNIKNIRKKQIKNVVVIAAVAHTVESNAVNINF